MEQLGRRVLYCDTDSVIYEHEIGEYNPPLGEFVGQLTDELEGHDIEKFVSNGAKNYGYQRSDGEQCLKVKGFTLNFNASQVITLDKMEEVATNDEGITLRVEEPRMIKRDLKRQRIISIPFTKRYRSTFDKRVKTGNYSVPYGFNY